MLTDNECWEIIAKIDWEKNGPTMNTTATSKVLAVRLGAEKSSALRSFVYNKEQTLSNAFTKWEQETGKNFGLGDDGFGDLCSHIVGLGKEKYEAHLAKPSLAFSRAKSLNFVEKFSYCIPDRYTVEITEDKSVIRYRERIVKSLTGMEENCPTLSGPLRKAISAVLSAESSALTHEEHKTLWKSICDEAEHIVDNAVATRKEFSIMENAISRLRGESYLNYVKELNENKSLKEILKTDQIIVMDTRH